MIDDYFLFIKINFFILCICRTKLDEALSRWQSYDELFNDLSKWLKDFELKLKQAAGPRTDLLSKQNQLDVIKVLLTVCCVAQSYVYWGTFIDQQYHCQ